MIAALAFKSILGLPVIAWGGMFGLILLLLVATIGALNSKGINFLNVKWHKAIALAAIIVSLAHGLMGLLAVLGY
jgi:hypothetical protein